MPSHHLGRNLFIIQPQALIQMKNGNDEDQDNLKATYGALFFGVPNQGMDISSLVPVVGDQPNRYFLESLGPESDLLQEQRATFPKVFDFRDSEIISFFETKLSPTALEVSLIKPFFSQVHH
jgi:protein SERAC1